MSDKELLSVREENIQCFVEKVMECAKDGYSLVDTGELQMSIQTNYWCCTLEREVVKEEPTEPTEPTQQEVKPRGRVTKAKE